LTPVFKQKLIVLFSCIDYLDVKGYCGMSEYMVRSWNAWHHHMALIMLAMLILLSYKIKFMKFHKISLHGFILVMKFHNPLKILNAGKIARIFTSSLPE